VCHQSVGLIARQLEEAGFPTIGLTSARTITARVNPPRSVFLDAPLGHTSGPPEAPEIQRSIVEQALDLAVSMTRPGTITDLDLRWHNDDWKSSPLGWSRRNEDGERPTGSDSAGGDSRTARSDVPRYQFEADRLAAEM
jgi:hypothetical protein